MSELIDNRAHRIRTLKHVIKQLHEGKGIAPEHVKAQLKELVRQTDSSEIAAMEQELMAEGMPVEEVRSMCDLHAEVLHEIMVEPPPPPLPPGHPVETFRRENAALQGVVGRAKQILADLRGRPEAARLGELLAAFHAAPGLGSLLGVLRR